MEKTTAAIKRVAILGAESTGKTTLARSLALRFGTTWVPEYAREYISNHPETCTADEIVQMTRTQLEQEEQLMLQASKIIFSDTEQIVAKVWCEDVFGSAPAWFEENLLAHPYDLYLLTSNDLPWIADPVRVNPQRRDYFFNWYKRELDHYNLKYEIITGRYEQRLLNAIRAIEKHFQLK